MTDSFMKDLGHYNPHMFLKLHNLHLNISQNSNTELVFIGDSITCNFDKNIFNKEFSKYKALNFGINGDRVQHIVWRLQNGLLDNIKPKVVVLLIGVNNFGNDPKDTAFGIKEIIRLIQLKLVNTNILLCGIFPFGENPDIDSRKYVKDVNNIIQNYNNDKIHYIDFGYKFLNSTEHIEKDIMYDFIHLTTKGYTIFANSIKDIIDNIMK
jgi:hypothetical protein